MPMPSQHLLVGHRLCQSGKISRFYFTLWKKRNFLIGPRKINHSISGSKLMFFKLLRRTFPQGELHSCKTHLRPRWWQVIKEDKSKTNRCVLLSAICVLLSAIHTNLFVRVLRSKYNNLVEFDQAFCGQGRVEWSFARRRIV